MRCNKASVCSRPKGLARQGVWQQHKVAALESVHNAFISYQSDVDELGLQAQQDYY